MSADRPPPPARILVVDDELFARLQLRHCLEREGYQVLEAENGEEALAVFNQMPPDAVLMDAMMPNVDGFECCRQMRQKPGGDRLPILMITGLDDRASIDRAFEAGAEDYVTKPVHWDVLRQRIRRAIERAELQQRLEAANRELARLAAADSLTQLANRRRFDEVLDLEWRRLARDHQPLALVLCDIDRFKLYNDTFGHLAGDQCIQQIARTLANTVNRPADLVARYGGEEFALILPNTNPVGAACVSARLCEAVRSLNLTHASAVGNFVTLSVGTAVIIPHIEGDPSQLVAMADEALYQAKRDGRNCYRTNFSPPTLELDSTWPPEPIAFALHH